MLFQLLWLYVGLSPPSSPSLAKIFAPRLLSPYDLTCCPYLPQGASIVLDPPRWYWPLVPPVRCNVSDSHRSLAPTIVSLFTLSPLMYTPSRSFDHHCLSLKPRAPWPIFLPSPYDPTCCLSVSSSCCCYSHLAPRPLSLHNATCCPCC